MTEYTNRIAFMAPVEHVDACNRAANALGRTGVNLSVPLSPTGQPPVTHYGGSAVETDLFLSVLAVAPKLPEGMEWPEALSAEDWQAVSDHLTVVSAPASEVSASQQFADMISSAGLNIIRYEDTPPTEKD